ncbi:MAG: hypothetical protein CMB80_00720 [Flammeovirgaceae bacterium]|nr:hypothetical protein [Flammeovirgaceae bacterium]
MATTASWYQSTSWTAADEGNKASPSGGSGLYGDTQQSDKVLKSYKFSKDSFEDSRTESERNVRYVNNDSWSSTELSAAQTSKKPALKYNIIIPIISTLQGNEQLNRRNAKIKPMGRESVDIADIMQQRWNATVDEQSLEDKLQIAFLDALSTRLGGWVERRFVVNADGYLDFHYDIVNNFRIFPDPETRASDYKLANCRWIVKEGWETLDVVKEKYGLKPSEYQNEKKFNWWNTLNTIFQRTKDKVYSGDSESYDKENDRYKILEMQERVTRKVYKCYDGERYFTLEPVDFAKAKVDSPDLNIVSETFEDKIHITTIIPYFNNAILIDEDSPSPIATFDVFPVLSYNYNVQLNEQTSLVDLLIDIQDDVNKAKSQVRDYVTQILSGGVFIDKREKETIKQLKKFGNQPNQVYELNNPAIPPQKMPPGAIPPDIMLNSENSFNYAQRVSLISEAMKGETARSGESGVLFQQKVERAAAAINPYFKNLSRLRKSLTEDFVDHFPFVYAEEDRVIETKGSGGIYEETILNMTMAGKVLNNVQNPSIYVELDEGEENITTKEENFNKMLALVNVIGQINPGLVDVKSLVEIAPFPGSDKMVQYIEAQAEAQAQAAAKQGDLDATKATLENLKIERGIVTDQEKLRIDAMKAGGRAR